MKLKKLIMSLSLLGATAALIGCSAGGESSGGSISPPPAPRASSSALIFADGGAVPVTAGSKSAGLYILNNSESAINGISYSIANNLGQTLGVIDGNNCSTLAAHSGCMLHYRLPKLSESWNMGSAVISASYQADKSYRNSHLLNFEYIAADRLPASGWQLSAAELKLSAAGNNGMLYYYAGNAATQIDSVSGSNISVVGDSLPQKLSAGEVGSVAIHSSQSQQLTVRGSDVEQQLQLKSAQLASAQLVTGVVPLLNAETGASSSLPVANVGNHEIKITEIKASSSDIQINTAGASSCQVGSSYASAAACNVDFSVLSSSPGTGTITITYTDNADPAAAAQTVSGQLAWYNQQPYALLSLSNDLSTDHDLSSEASVTLTLSNQGARASGYKLAAFSNSNVSISKIADSCNGHIAAKQNNCSISFAMNKTAGATWGSGFAGVSVNTTTTNSPLTVGLAKYTIPKPPVVPVFLPQTGQITSYAAKDDGALKLGVPWADNKGQPLVPATRFTPDPADSNCIIDNLTGLEWSKNANLFGTKTWNDALTAVAAMNTTAGATGYKLCGYSDWRLANVNELVSLVNYGQSNPASWLNTQGFTNVQAGSYWSSTSYAGYTGNAWPVNMYYGNVNYAGKGNSYYVWPVRGGQ